MHQYYQEGYPTDKLFLTEEEYVRALQSLVKYCHDILLLGPDGSFYLPNRNRGGVTPHPWFIGGAVKPFTPVLDSAIRVAARETGITFAPERFAHVRQNRYWFNGRELNSLRHDALCEIYILRLSAEEIEAIQLDPEEYEVAPLAPYQKEDIQNIENEFVRKIFLDLWNEKDSWK